MVILKGRIPNGRIPNGRATSSSDGVGIHWHQLDFRDPGVLTVLVDGLPVGSRRIATDPGVRPPSEESETWTLDLDAVREQAHPTLARGIPPWASGKVTVEPTPEGSAWRFEITPQLFRQ